MITRETLTRLEFDKILMEIAGNARSEVTRQRVLDTVPLSDAVAIRTISGRIGEIRMLAALAIGLRLSAFQDIRPLLEALRPAGAFLSPLDLLLFLPVLDMFGDIARQFGPRSDIPLLKLLEPPLRPFSDILEPLTASIDHEGNIMDSASSKLAEIRRAKRSLSSRIRRKIEEIVRDNNIEIFLQDDFITQRSGRWVIPVRMDSKGMVKGVVHDVSASGETAFMEPLEIIPFVNELENLSAEEKAEEIRILRQLSAWIREDAAEIGACFETLVTLDELDSIARFADRNELETAALNGEGLLVLAGARHPLLLMQQRRGALARVEPLDLQLDDQRRVMVITGPNAGGKTIALKTAGVLVLMALSGIPVPADGARSTFPLLDTLLVDIGDEQSIEQSLSTFSAHIARIATILDQAGPLTLVLLDELGAGTEPQQGAAIACGVLRDLQERGAAVIATTHISEIIGYVHRTPGMINAGMEYDAESYTPLYRLISGEPGHSHAIEIARRYGMPERVIEFAREMLGSAGEEFTTLLAELHRKRDELDQARAELGRQQDQVRSARIELEAAVDSIDRARAEAGEKAWGEARELISVTRRRMNELLDEYKRERRSASIEKLRLVEREISSSLRPQDPGGDQLQPLRSVTPGDSVHVRSLGHNGVVLLVDPKQARARIRAGSMELDVALSDLAVSVKAGPVKKQRAPGREWQVDTAESAERELKLIGLRVVEALDLLDPFLSQASLSGCSEVRIIHGLGSGKLRQAVREHLARHLLVESFRPGEAHEGRDGATVVTMRD
jgi:DNA mismatch repair protein MutS2